MGRKVQKPKDSNRRIVVKWPATAKPEPPDDLYIHLNEDMADLAIKLPPPRPKDGTSFTREEFAAKYNITKDMAKRAIAKLLKAGRIKVVMAGAASYYVRME